MEAKAILSSKGQLVIPRRIRQKLGLHTGSELILELTAKNSLEILPVKNDISDFFGMGKNSSKNKSMSIKDIDKAISNAIKKNDRYRH